MIKEIPQWMIDREMDFRLLCTNPEAWLEKEEAELRAFEEAWGGAEDGLVE